MKKEIRFTLIELLVVIAIIAILAANGLKRGRYAPSALQNYRLTLPPLVRLHAPGAGCGQCQQAHDGWGERPIASGQFGRLSGAAQRKA